MQPFFTARSLWVWPVYGGIGASFGYWLQGAEERQMRYLTETKMQLLEKRRRRAEREGGNLNVGSPVQRGEEGLIATPGA